MPTSVPGAVGGEVSIYLHGQIDHPTKILLSGEAVKTVEATPPMVMAGSFTPEKEMPFRVRLNSPKGKLPKIVAVKSGVAKDLNFQADGSDTVVTGKLSVDAMPGEYSGFVSVTFDGMPDAPFQIPITYEIAPFFKVAPETVNFGEISGERAIEEIGITGEGAAGIKIARKPRGLSIETTSKGQNDLKLQITYSPTGSKRLYLAEKIVLETGDPRQPKIIVPVYGAAGKPLEDVK